MSRTIASIVGVAAVVLITACQKAPERPADHVFLNGGIYTVDSHRSWAEAAPVSWQRDYLCGWQRRRSRPDRAAKPE